MSAVVEARRARVLRVVQAAREVAADPSIVEPLVRTTGLSLEGVVLALRDHLETNPSPEEVDRLVARAKAASHVHIVLSANVFTASLRAIACAVAAAPRVSVQVSSREPVFASALLAAIADRAISSVDRDALSEVGDGEIHVYGRAETIASVKARARVGVVVRGHGPGLGVAIVGEKDSLGDAARALAKDVVPFDQRGCLSPRVAFVLGDEARAEAFGEKLGAELAKLGEKVPRGTLSEVEAADAARYVETLRFAGKASFGRGWSVGIGSSPVLPPAARIVHVVPFVSTHALAELVAPLASLVTVVGTSEREIASIFPASVRVSQIGNMQKPPFDGPVDLRVL